MIRFINDIVAYPSSSVEFRKLGAKDRQKRKKRNLVAAGLIGSGLGAAGGYYTSGLLGGINSGLDLGAMLDKNDRGMRYVNNPKLRNKAFGFISKRLQKRLLPFVAGGTALGAGLGAATGVARAMRNNQEKRVR